MEARVESPPSKRSVGEWLFQLTTITIGVLIALSFDAFIQWNANRTLVDEARRTIAFEIDRNRREIDAHLTTFTERVAKVSQALLLITELEAGTEPTVHEVDLGVAFPSLSEAGWQTAQRTGALALMDYADVQELAELYTLQALVTDNLGESLLVANRAGSVLASTPNPFTMSVAVRDDFRARVVELHARLKLDNDLGKLLSQAFAEQAADGDAAR